MAEDRQVHSNAQVAEILGISEGTIRTWKKREADQLQENVHWLTQNNKTLWTAEGIEALRQINSTVSAKNFETDSLETDETETVSDPFQRYTSLINAVAAAVSPGIVQRIDTAVLQKVKRAIATPMTPAECVVILTEFGLAPADPSVLVNGSDIAGYLPETPHN
jgi:hypothetical protein